MSTKLNFARAAGDLSPTRASRIIALLLLGGATGLAAGCAPVDESTDSVALAAVNPPVTPSDVRSTLARGVVASPVDTADRRAVVTPGVIATEALVTDARSTVPPGLLATLTDTTEARARFSVGVVATAVDTSDMRARMGDGVTPTPIDTGDPTTRVLGTVFAPLPAEGTLNLTRSAVGNVLTELSFENGEFVRTVDRLAMAYSVKGGALTMVPVANDAEAQAWISRFVAASGGVDAASVHALNYNCPTALACAGSFLYTVSSGRADYATALLPAATRIVTMATEVTTTIWSPVLNGLPLFDVVTLHGTVRGHLVGLVYFR